MNTICIVDIGNCDLFSYHEYQENKIHKCRGAKKNKHKATKKLFKRLMNKKRRQITLNPKHFTNYWA